MWIDVDPFVGVTDDFLKADGSNGFGEIGLELLDEANIRWEYFSSPAGIIADSHANRYSSMLVLGPRVTSETLRGMPRLRHVARFGVGYDNIDIPACNQAGVALTITPEGVRRPVAVAALTLVLSLSHKLLIKDRLVREGRWNERLDHNGQGVTGRCLGIVGFGNIGQELAHIAAPLSMDMIAFDPFFSVDRGKKLGVQSVGLDDLLRRSDYVVICCALNDGTRGLIGEREFAQMKSNGYLINVARGPIVDQSSLRRALEKGQIAGAGLDVFETEPIDPQDPLLKLENVIVSPHALCWTDECFGLNGRSAIQSIIDLIRGIQPSHVVNPAAFSHTRWTTQ